MGFLWISLLKQKKFYGPLVNGGLWIGLWRCSSGNKQIWRQKCERSHQFTKPRWSVRWKTDHADWGCPSPPGQQQGLSLSIRERSSPPPAALSVFQASEGCKQQTTFPWSAFTICFQLLSHTKEKAEVCVSPWMHLPHEGAFLPEWPKPATALNAAPYGKHTGITRSGNISHKVSDQWQFQTGEQRQKATSVALWSLP